MEEAHVLGAAGAIGQRVAGERPVDCVVKPVTDAVSRTQHKDDRDGLRKEGDEDERHERLEASAGEDEDLALTKTV